MWRRGNRAEPGHVQRWLYQLWKLRVLRRAFYRRRLQWWWVSGGHGRERQAERGIQRGLLRAVSARDLSGVSRRAGGVHEVPISLHFGAGERDCVLHVQRGLLLLAVPCRPGPLRRPGGARGAVSGGRYVGIASNPRRRRLPPPFKALVEADSVGGSFAARWARVVLILNGAKFLFWYLVR